jgi:hypothetical protein
MAPQNNLYSGTNNTTNLNVPIQQHSSSNSLNASSLHTFPNSLTSSGNISSIVHKMNPSTQQITTNNSSNFNGNSMKNRDSIPYKIDIKEKLIIN